MLQRRSLKNNSNIFNKNFLIRPVKQDEVDFSLALKSIDIPEENFMNFFTSNQTDIYLKLKEMYELSLNNSFNIDKYFSNKEYTTTNPIKNNRIRKFIYETSNSIMDDQDLLGMIKYKHREKSNFQLFVKYEKAENKAYVYLIDIYHLVLPTEFRQMHQRRPNAESYYLKMCNRLKGDKCGLESLKAPETTANKTMQEV